jgi:hypothetical protein
VREEGRARRPRCQGRACVVARILHSVHAASASGKMSLFWRVRRCRKCHSLGLPRNEFDWMLATNAAAKANMASCALAPSHSLRSRRARDRSLCFACAGARAYMLLRAGKGRWKKKARKSSCRFPRLCGVRDKSDRERARSSRTERKGGSKCTTNSTNAVSANYVIAGRDAAAPRQCLPRSCSRRADAHVQ